MFSHLQQRRVWLALVWMTLAIGVVGMSGCQRVASATALPKATFTAHDLAFDGPESIPGGWVRLILKNDGPDYYHLQLVKLAEGKTVDDLAAALQESLVPPLWATMVGGPNPVDPGASTSAVVNLTPGDYAVISTVPDRQGVPHVAQGMVRRLTVTHAENLAPEPVADVTMDLQDFSFVLHQPLVAGRQTVRVNNQGHHEHEVWLARLGEGKSPMDLLMALAPDAAPEDWVYNGMGGLAWIYPGSYGYFTADLEPGRYALICFVPTQTGEMHFMLGMIQEIVVP
jgi:hypothetical protein